MTIDDDDTLTEEGRAEVEALTRRHGVGPDAVLVLLHALERSGGDQAQFSHPDLGGMGQWSRGGMIMVGDMFNNALKARVDSLCHDTAALLGRSGLMRPGRRGTAGGGGWWPDGCGRPSATGAQNDMRYACFPDTRRLAIGHGDRVDLYDTGEHRIHGVSQQQGQGYDLRFTSQLGTVALHELARIGTENASRAASPREPAPPRPQDTAMPRPGSDPTQETPVSSPSHSSSADILDTLERLHALHHKGVLSDTEFAEKKKELLGRL